jgi:hypothetical protein
LDVNGGQLLEAGACRRGQRQGHDESDDSRERERFHATTSLRAISESI